MAEWKAMENLNFREMCRMPGTRINAIMSLIEQGFADGVIAKIWNTDAQTISVYRKALRAKLSKGIKALVFDNDAMRAAIEAMRGADDSPEAAEKRAEARAEADKRRDNSSPEAVERIRQCRELMTAFDRGELGPRYKLDITDALGAEFEIVQAFGSYARAEETANMAHGTLRRGIAAGQLSAQILRRLDWAGCDMIGAGWVAPSEPEKEEET